MKSLLPSAIVALFVVTLTAAAAAQSEADASSAPNGTPGVEDGTCWKNNSGNEVEVDVRGTVHGDQEVTFTEGDASGAATGTPDPDGGCAESSTASVGSESYRIKDSEVQWKNDNGDWIDMSETKCEDEVEPGTDEGSDGTIGTLPATTGDTFAPGGDTIGSLPSIVKADGMLILRDRESGTVTSLPA